MAKVLYITANPKPIAESFALRTGQAFINAYRETHPQDEVEHIDLFKIRVPVIDAVTFSAWDKLEKKKRLTDIEQSKINGMNAIVDQFVSGDKYVFVTSFWNFLFPPVVKAYVDAICVAGKTFKYTDRGLSVGLLGDKSVVHIQARGGYYSEGAAQDLEFGDRYLRTIFAFLGITNVQSVIAEGLAFDSSKAEEIVARAMERAREVARNF